MLLKDMLIYTNIKVVHKIKFKGTIFIILHNLSCHYYSTPSENNELSRPLQSNNDLKTTQRLS